MVLERRREASLFHDNFTKDDKERGFPSYAGENPDSNGAYFGIDLIRNEKTHEAIVVNSFERDVKRSNDCVRGISDRELEAASSFHSI
ncbi:MAG: hypothetical protein LBB61_06610 [Treponema sp.]|jgi:hypothetical protein|nr:hypothetical protein [Treponema sp.]